jgi:hypothetical protein
MTVAEAVQKLLDLQEYTERTGTFTNKSQAAVLNQFPLEVQAKLIRLVNLETRRRPDALYGGALSGEVSR